MIKRGKAIYLGCHVRQEKGECDISCLVSIAGAVLRKMDYRSCYQTCGRIVDVEYTDDPSIPIKIYSDREWFTSFPEEIRLLSPLEILVLETQSRNQDRR